jgi:hypothetical protein
MSRRLADMMRYLAAPVLLLACAPKSSNPDARESPSGPVADSIVLERSMCFGTCPAYRLRLSQAGEIHFESRNPGEGGRTASDTITAATLPFLISRARAVGFFDLPQEIASDSVLCRDRATDHPTVVISVFTKDGIQRVRDYHGCFETTEHGVLPQIRRLRLFESEIDSVLQSTRWVRPARRR